MGYISIEWGLIKISIIIFSLIFILIGIYPFILNFNLFQAPRIEDKLLHILLVILGFIQLFLLGIKSKRPRID